MFIKQLPVYLLSLIGSLYAAGGPPMITDDAQTPGNNNFEINIAFEGDLRSNIQRYEFPIIDINYGIGENIQLKIESPYVALLGDRNIEAKGIGNTTDGMKWRFYENSANNLLISTYPQYIFTPVKESLHSGVAEINQALFLPIEISKKIEELSVTGEFGYRAIKNSRNEMEYGVVVGYEISEDLELLAELHNTSYLSGGNMTIIANGGFTYKISPKYSLLFSVGRELISPEESKSTLLYAGLQLHY